MCVKKKDFIADKTNNNISGYTKDYRQIKQMIIRMVKQKNIVIVKQQTIEMVKEETVEF